VVEQEINADASMPQHATVQAEAFARGPCTQAKGMQRKYAQQL